MWSTIIMWIKGEKTSETRIENYFVEEKRAIAMSVCWFFFASFRNSDKHRWVWLWTVWMRNWPKRNIAPSLKPWNACVHYFLVCHFSGLSVFRPTPLLHIQQWKKLRSSTSCSICVASPVRTRRNDISLSYALYFSSRYNVVVHAGTKAPNRFRFSMRSMRHPNVKCSNYTHFDISCILWTF